MKEKIKKFIYTVIIVAAVFYFLAGIGFIISGTPFCKVEFEGINEYGEEVYGYENSWECFLNRWVFILSTLITLHFIYKVGKRGGLEKL